MPDKIVVLDFGSQYSHLIVRRFRELGIFSELLPPEVKAAKLRRVKGIVISGGPRSVGHQAIKFDRGIFKLGIPILGICYGLQLIAHELGGRVKTKDIREYGPTAVKILKRRSIFFGLKSNEITWMSHRDQVVKLPKGFIRLAKSKNCAFAAIGSERMKIYGLQFHPEVSHTVNGKKILENFARVTKARKGWSMEGFIGNKVKEIREIAGDKNVVCALSGGVDSSVAAVLAHQAIGRKLHCIYIDTGLMRLGETRQIVKTFNSYQNMNLKVVRAKDIFLRSLAGVKSPERKRKIIGNIFIRLFETKAKKIKNAKWLLQGTLYTDAITSGISVGKKAAVIKSHHNVGGLPKKFGLKLIEPLRYLYKDEVRQIGRILGLPPEIVKRQPFPGPGLAIRIIGEVSQRKLNIVRKADFIVRDEINKTKYRKIIQQYFAVLPDIKSVGVQGDARTYGYPIIIRAISTKDFMTADYSRISHSLLSKISNRITNEIKDVNRVVYDITSKPPGTVEWE